MDDTLCQAGAPTSNACLGALQGLGNEAGEAAVEALREGVPSLHQPLLHVAYLPLLPCCCPLLLCTKVKSSIGHSSVSNVGNLMHRARCGWRHGSSALGTLHTSRSD